MTIENEASLTKADSSTSLAHKHSYLESQFDRAWCTF